MAYKRESPIHMFANTNSMDEKNKVGPKVGGSVSGEIFSKKRIQEYKDRNWAMDHTTHSAVAAPKPPQAKNDITPTPYFPATKAKAPKAKAKAPKVGGESNNSYVKPGGKATGSMKDYKIGSQARRDEYTARGWKQDATTKGTKGLIKQKAKTVGTIKSAGITGVAQRPKAKSIELASPKQGLVGKKNTTVKSKAPKSTKLTRSQKLRAKGEEALASGKKSKARRIRKRYDRAVAREAKK